MAAEILLRPGNRALDYSTTDFSNYGAQPTTTVQFAPSSLPGGAVPPQPEEQPAAPEPPQQSALAPQPETALSTEPDPTSELMPETNGALPDGGNPQALHNSAVDLAPLVPSPMGSSNPVTGDISTVARDGIDSDRTTVDDVRVTAEDAHAGVAGLAAGDLATNVGILLNDPIVATLPATTAALVANTVEDAVQALDGTVASTLDGLSGAANAVGDVAAAAAPVDLLGSAVAATSDTVAETDIDLSQFAGSDPAAGVTTLVDMVATDNLFDLRDAGAPPEAVETATSPIDQLAGEVPAASPLLGEAAQHDDNAPDLSGGTLHDDLGI